MSAEPLSALAPASPPPDLALARCDADCDKVLAMIPGGTRVLAVGDIDPVLLRDLEDQDCSVVRVAAEAVGRPDAPDPRGATEDGSLPMPAKSKLSACFPSNSCTFFELPMFSSQEQRGKRPINRTCFRTNCFLL